MKGTKKILCQASAVLGLMLTMVSCDKYLDMAPSKSGGVQITTIEQLNGMLSRVTYDGEKNDIVSFGSDSYELSTDLYNANPSDFPPYLLSNNFWEVGFLESEYSNKQLWTGEFNKIFTANIIMMSVDGVTGTPEEKQQIKSEVHLMRAYSYFTLVNTYCLPYNEKNKNEIGLPIKQSTSYEENITRVSLEETYNFIERDIKEALKVTLSASKKRNWRGNIAAANGLAARFYLAKGDYKAAFKHAQVALDDYSEQVDYNTDMKFCDEGKFVTIDGSSDNPQDVEVVFPYLYDINTGADWNLVANYKGNYYFRTQYTSDWWYVPSAKLLALYDHNYDLRYKYHIVQNFSYYDMGMDDPSYSYPGYVTYGSSILSAPCSAEMLLIKAECIARDASLGSLANAMEQVNALRVKRFSTSAPSNVVNLSASTPQEAVKLIMDERQREMPFTQRWFDIRRCNSNNDPSDDITLVKRFYPIQKTGALTGDPIKEYRLEPNSRRYAMPIPADDIKASRGVLKQNTY